MRKKLVRSLIIFILIIATGIVSYSTTYTYMYYQAMGSSIAKTTKAYLERKYSTKEIDIAVSFKFADVLFKEDIDTSKVFKIEVIFGNEKEVKYFYSYKEDEIKLLDVDKPKEYVEKLKHIE